MAEINTLVVQRSQEESARNGVFFERDFTHQQADPKAWPKGEVWIADDQKHKVAHTSGVMAAIRSGRLVKVGQPQKEEVDPDKVVATDAAQKLAEEANVDLAAVPPTGKNGQVTKPDVEKFIQRSKDESSE